MKPSKRTFTCYVCGRDYKTDEPAILHDIPYAPEDELVSLCDDCSVMTERLITEKAMK